MNKKYLSLGLAAAVLVALFAMALHDPLRFPVINRVVTAVITPFAAASSAVGGWVDDTGEAMTTVKTLQQQNEVYKAKLTNCVTPTLPWQKFMQKTSACVKC